MNKKTVLFTGVLIFTIIACELSNNPNSGNLENSGFETEAVEQIFLKNCTTSGCHAGTNPPDGLLLTSHSNLFEGSKSQPVSGASNFGGEVVIPYRSDKSLLYQVVSNNLSTSLSVNHRLLSSSELQTLQKWIDDGAKDYEGNVPFATPESYRVYVCNQTSDLISVVDGTNNVVERLANVDLTANFNDKPHMVKESGNYYYVTLIAAGKFLKISKATNEIVGEVDGLGFPGMIQIMNNGVEAFVSRSSTAPGVYSSIYLIDILNMQLKKEINLLVSGLPHAMAFSPNNNTLYVANLTANVIHIVDTSLDEDFNVIPLSEDHQPMQTAISPDGYYLYISARGTSKLLVFDTQSKQVVYQVSLNSMPMQISVRPDGDKIFVSSMGGDVVEVITKSGFTWSKTNEISHPTFNMLHGSDITADGRYLYVSSRNTDGAFVPPYRVKNEGARGTLGVIDVQAESVVKVIEIEEFGAGLVVEK